MSTDARTPTLADRLERTAKKERRNAQVTREWLEPAPVTENERCANKRWVSEAKHHDAIADLLSEAAAALRSFDEEARMLEAMEDREPIAPGDSWVWGPPSATPSPAGEPPDEVRELRAALANLAHFRYGRRCWCDPEHPIRAEGHQGQCAAAYLAFYAVRAPEPTLDSDRRERLLQEVAERIDEWWADPRGDHYDAARSVLKIPEIARALARTEPPKRTGA